MAEAADDLVWDYTGDESSPFLRRAVSPTFRTERPCGISRRQACYLYHSVSEVAHILAAELNRDRLNGIQSHSNTSSSLLGRIAAGLQRYAEQLSHLNIRYIPISIIILLIAAVASEAIWDAADNGTKHLPYLAAVLSTLSMLLLVLFYVVTFLKFGRRTVTLCTLLFSFLSTLFAFAAVYAVFVRFSIDSWSALITVGDNFVVTYCLMLEFSASILTLNSAAFVRPALWYISLVTSLQMIVAYCHLVAIVALAVRYLNETYRSNASLVNGELLNRPLTRLDPDNDSLAVSDVRVTATVEPEIRSRRLQDGRSPAGGAPVAVLQRPNSVTADVDDDLLLSHSV